MLDLKPAGRVWERTDTLIAAALTLVAGALRYVGIGSPRQLVFDEVYYVPDACRYVIEAQDLCGLDERTFFHPPLGKWLIAFGMELLGPTRYGWRFMPALFGTLTVLLVYVLAHRLTGSRIAAAAAGVGLAIDPLHFVHSRIAVLEIFVAFFVVAALLCVVVDRDDARTGIWRPWLLGSGVALGCAIATKWSGGFIAPVLVGASIWWSVRKPDTEPDRGWRSSVAAAGLSFVIVPLFVYALSYAGRLDQPLLAAPWEDASWVGFLIDRQVAMLDYHRTLRGAGIFPPHVLSSPAWSWLLLKRPMMFFFLEGPRGYEHVLATGNPVTWFASIPAFIYLSVRTWLKRSRDEGSLLILLAFAACYLPWLVFTFGADPYLFYLVPAVPFMYLALGRCFQLIWTNRVRLRGPLLAWAVTTLAAFVFLYPVLTARPLPRDAWIDRMLYRDCIPRADEDRGEPPLPNRTGHGTWCWI